MIQTGFNIALLALTLVLLVPSRTEAKTWHISQTHLPDVADQHVSIGEVVPLLVPGDTVVVHSGVYREKVIIDTNGLPDKPIRFEAAIGARVVVTGADIVTDWQCDSEQDAIYFAPWPHRFVTWNEHNTHPNDDYHRLIGRCEQVFVNGYPLHQVLERDKMSRGTFFVDLDAGTLYAWAANSAPLNKKRHLVEASSREQIWVCNGDYVHVKGIRFQYAANRAQQGAVLFGGDHNLVENCTFENTNASGATLTGEHITVRNCTFQNNGQLGFSVNRAHSLHMSGCTVRNNNTKGYNRGWEAGGNKIVLTRGVVIEHSVFTQNRGNGIWFDIGNEENVVRNCLITHNENAGIFYEISYGLHAHDNVIIGNGFGHDPGAWGASSGISISSSPGCVIERNLLIGNKEGFNFREQTRSTPLINDERSVPVWNHDHVIRHNVIAYNRDAQTWGWFDINDDRHWPKGMQTSATARQGKATDDIAGEYIDSEDRVVPAGLSLEALAIRFEGNLYATNPGQGLFHWGVTWKEHRRYDSLDAVRQELALEQQSRVADVVVADFADLDLRVPPHSPVLEMRCYPQGEIPGVRLGMMEP